MSPSSQLTRHASTRLRDKRALPSVQPFCYFTSHSFLTVYFIKSNQALHPQTLVKMLLLQLGETIHSSSMLQNALAFCANAPRDPLALPAALPSHPQPFSTWIQNSDQPSNFVLAIASAVPLLLSCFLPTKKRSLFQRTENKALLCNFCVLSLALCTLKKTSRGAGPRRQRHDYDLYLCFSEHHKRI